MINNFSISSISSAIFLGMAEFAGYGGGGGGGGDMGMDVTGAEPITGIGFIDSAIQWIIDQPPAISALIFTVLIILLAMLVGRIIGKLYVSIRYPDPDKPQILTPLQKIGVIIVCCIIGYTMIRSLFGYLNAGNETGDLSGDGIDMSEPGEFDSENGELDGNTDGYSEGEMKIGDVEGESPENPGDDTAAADEDAAADTATNTAEGAASVAVTPNADNVQIFVNPRS